MLTRGRSIKPSVKLAAVLFAFGVFLTTMTGTSSSPAAAMQIGATASSLSNGYGLKGVIGQPNTFVGGNLGRAYWIAVTFDNHDFFQAGFLDAGRDYSGENFCHTGFSTFVTGLNGNQNLLPGLYNPEHCGLTGTHTFRLDNSRSTPQYVFWQWYLDGSPIGPSLQEPYYVNHFARANAGAISELVKVGDADGTEQFPNVHYSTAINVENADGTFSETTNGKATASSDRTCGFTIRVVGPDDFKTGRPENLNNPPCYQPGDSLW